MKSSFRRVFSYLNTKVPLIIFIILNFYYFIIGFSGFIYRYKYFCRNKISSSVKVTGWRNVCLGKNVVICSRTWLNVNHRNSSSLKSIKIGDNSFIGEDNFFTSGSGIDIGPYVLTASHCSFIGSSHVINDPLKPYLSTGVDDDKFIKVGANCFFGYGASVIGNVSIGHGSIIGAKSTVFSDIPPFSIAVGNPAKVVKRFDFKTGLWVKPEELISVDMISESDYVNLLSDGNEFLLMPYILANSRFNNII